MFFAVMFNTCMTKNGFNEEDMGLAGSGALMMFI